LSVACLESCGTANPTYVDSQCVDGQWQCPPNTIDRDLCSRNSCATSPARCCNVTTGIVDAPACLANGTVAACSAGSILEPDIGCIPPALGVSDCMELHGRSCDGSVLHCNQFLEFCNCETNESGQLAWHCEVLLM
jgi:hypothetical protein